MVVMVITFFVQLNCHKKLTKFAENGQISAYFAMGMGPHHPLWYCDCLLL